MTQLARSTPVHEIVLDTEGQLASVRGVGSAEIDRISGLIEIARRAGGLCERLEFSFVWRDESGERPCTSPVFATVRTLGHPSRTTLSWRVEAHLPHGLTARELDVLTLLIGGLSNAEIATRLWASPRTVTTHVERILGKLEVASRTAAAAVAVEESLLLLPVPGGPEGFERFLLGILSGGDVADQVPVGAPQPRPVDLPGRRRAPSSNRRAVQRPVLLGSAFPSSGPASEDGIEMIRASQLAIGELNARGGIGGRAVELVNVDLDIVDPASIRLAFEKLAAHDVDAMLSGYLGDQQVAHEIAADHGAPYLHAATLKSMAQLVEDHPRRYSHIFQMCPSDTYYGPGFVQTMTHLLASGRLPVASRSLAIVRGKWKLGDLGIEEAARLAEQQGWRLDYVADDVSGEVEWREQGRRIAELAPAAVMIGSYFMHETIPFVRAFQAEPSPTVLYALYAPSIPRFRVELGPLAEGILWATTTGTYSDRVAADFGERYRRAWAAVPGRSHAGIAYDRVQLLASAWSNADSPRDFHSVAESLRHAVHRGVNGAYSFDEVRQSALSYPMSTADPSIALAHLVFQIQDSRQRIVHPSPYAETSFRCPPWFPA